MLGKITKGKIAIQPEDKSLFSKQVNKTLRVFMLGRFEVEQDGRRLIKSEQWRNGKARSLFKIMLTRRAFQISRQEAATLLWPELDPERAANNLNQALYSLRRTFEPELKQASASVYLKAEGSKLQLNPSLIRWIDADEFTQLYRQAQLTSDISLYEQASTLYHGDYLPEDIYEDWSVYRREALRQDWVDLLLQMAALYQAQGQDEKYVRCLHRVMESDFSHEGAVQKLMRALAESGRREEALTFYRNFVSKLKNRLSIEPFEETRQLYQEIAAGSLPVRININAPKQSNEAKPVQNVKPFDTVLATTHFAATTASSPPTLPVVPVRGVVGRILEQRQWGQSLREALGGKGGLTVLQGEAGIGKSYLTQVLAQQASEAGFEVLYFTCYPEQAELPFGSISELLELALSRLNSSELEECLKYCNYNPELYRFLPGMSNLLSGNKPASPESSLQGVFAAAAQVLAWLGRSRPLVLALDDLHFLPGPSARLLGYLLTHPSLRALLVLGSIRPCAIDLMRPELNRLLNWAGETGQQIHALARFDNSELLQLLTGQLGQTPDNRLLQLVSQASQNNPRLALELIQAWRKELRLQLVDGHWETNEKWNGRVPTSVMAYINRTMGGLSNDARVLLVLAALIGQKFSFEVLRQIVLHRTDGAGWWIELDKTKLGQALVEVTGCGLVEEQGDEYIFTYPLLVETLVASLPHNQRQCWQEVIEWAQEKTGNNQPVLEG